MSEPTSVAIPDMTAHTDAQADSHGGDAVAGTPTTPTPATSRPHPTRWRLWVVAAVLVGAFAFLLVEGLGSSLNYFETVDQAVQHRATLGTQTFRLEGVVVPGSVHRSQGGVDFVAAGSLHRVAVINHGNPPELFQPNIPVVVVGHFSSPHSNLFVSDQIMVKHSSSYIAGHPGRVQAPNGSVR